MVKAEKLDYAAVMQALEKGNFYSSWGPEIRELWYEDGKIHITCSDAERIILHASGRRSGSVFKPENGTLNAASFKVVPEDGYVRITVIDAAGKHANTNAYFIDELL